MVQTRNQVYRDKHRYEFAGPVGAFLISAVLPIVCYAGAFLCNDTSGCPVPSMLHPSTLTLQKLKKDVAWPGLRGLVSGEVFLYVCGWYLLSMILYRVLPARYVHGEELRIGGKHSYRINTFRSTIVTLAIALGGTLYSGADWPVWTYIWDHYVQILTSNILIAFALATYCYIASFSVPGSPKHLKRELAAGGVSGNIVYDWFIGREMNPRITLPFFGEIDIKFFMEMRPGMTGYIILDLAFMAHQYKTFGYITDSMLIVCANQAWYVLDAFYLEEQALYVLDITLDGFGFMLAFGDLVWLPFVYSWQARYLAMHPVSLGAWACAGVFAVQALGYWIFRSSNSQKLKFRANPNAPAMKNMQYITTKTGSKLLCSGWWGKARHINYMGDWIMSWAYCAPTGIAGFLVHNSSALKLTHDKPFVRQHGNIHGGVELVQGEARGYGMLFTYFYMLYFAILLIHRERRDDEKCHRKYGKDWEEYRRRVPSRIIPGIY